MEISQYIKNLLVSNERVILRDFGAFTTKQVSAKYDASTGTMKPPFKIVIFDKSIQEDSGLLSGHIANQDGITKESADEQINEYVKTVKSKLASGQTVEFKDLGTFNQAGDGTLDFAFLSEDNLLLNSFGLPTVSIEKKDTLAAPPPPTTKPKANVQTKKVVKEKPAKSVKHKVIKKRQPKIKTNAVKKKRTGLKIFTILFLAFGLILVAIYFFKPVLWEKGYNFSMKKIASVKQMIPGDKINYDIIDPDADLENTKDNTELDTNSTNTTSNSEEYTDDDDYDYEPKEKDNVVPGEEYDDNDVVEETPAVTPSETNTTVSPAQKGSYYIIVGSVKTESEAKKEQKRFSKKGISTSIIQAGKSRYRISMGEFNSAKEAQDYYSEMQSKHGNIEAWVWEKR